MSDGGGFDDGGGGPAGSLGGSPEPVFRRFLDSFMVVFGTVLFLYQDSVLKSTREVFCGPREVMMAKVS